MSVLPLGRFQGLVPTLPPLPPVVPAVVPTRDAAPVRADGRRNFELRPVTLRTGTVHDAVGSAYYAAGSGTRVMCTVRGPSQLPAARQGAAAAAAESGFLNVNVAVCPYVDGGRLSGRITAQNHNAVNCKLEEAHARLPTQLLQALDGVVLVSNFKHCEVSVSVTVYQDEGGCLAACINAAFAALALAKIPMRDLPVAVSLGIFLPPAQMPPEFSRLVAPAPPAQQAPPTHHGPGMTNAKAKLLAKRAMGPKKSGEAADQAAAAFKAIFEKPTIILDPTAAEMRDGPFSSMTGLWQAKAQMDIAILSLDSSASLVTVAGVPLGPELTAQALSVAQAACGQLGEQLRAVLKEAEAREHHGPAVQHSMMA